MYPIRRAYKAVKKLFSKKSKAAKKPVKRYTKPVCNGVVQSCKIKQEERDFVNCNSIETGVYTFELSDFPEYASYQALYEYYRIDKVQVTWRTMNNVATTGSVVNPAVSFIYQSAGRIHSVIDYNDSAPFAASRAGIQEMMQDQSYKCTTSTKNHSRTLVPHILMEGGGASVGVITKRKQWIPVGNTTASLTHYSLKYILEGGYQVNAAGTNISYMVEPTIKMWVSFKDPK